MAAVWNPANTRKKYNLGMSATERAKVEANMSPLARSQQLFDADVVFEGGGVLGTAFLGAVRFCSEIGIRWHGIAGTSAGAITGSLLAADLPIDHLEQIIGHLDFMSFLTKKTSRLIFNGDPSDDLEHPILLLTNLSMTGELGQYSAEPFKAWIDEVLRWAGKQSFGEMWDRSKVASDRQFKVVVSDVTRGEMKVLPDDLEPTRPTNARPGESTGNNYQAPIPLEYRPPLTPKQRGFSVAEAVRLSMSIPFFFEPGTLENSQIVDGGILSNFPLWLFDDDTPNRAPAWPTFGFRLVDRTEATPQQINSATGLLSAMLKTMMVARDRRYLSQRHQGRVIDIDLTGLNITPTQFSLTLDQKEQLYLRGYQSAKEFFLNRWSWKNHLTIRGF
jgi:NTE family protein